VAERAAVRVALAAVACALLAAGCSHAPRPRLEPDGSEVGIASYYASRFHGRRTASGERYDEDALTAAHRTLPFGTRVRVTNLDNGRSVEVRINDRGPHRKRRILDLSRRAAELLDMIRAGLARVRLEVIGGPAAAVPPRPPDPAP
jgi:rare lipoprotein A